MWGSYSIRRVGLWASALVVVAGLGSGVAHGQFERQKVGENERYIDEQHDFKLTQPHKWYIAIPGDITYNGRPVRSGWIQDELTGMMVAIDQSEAALKPSEIDFVALAQGNADGDKRRDKDDKKLEIAPERRDVRVIGGMKAAWFELRGRGLGFGLKEEGSVPTRQVWVVVPRGKEWIVFLLGAPEANYDRALRDFKKMLKTVEIGGKQTKAQAADPAVDPDADEPDEIDVKAERGLDGAEKLLKEGKYADALKAYDEVGVKYAARKAGKRANERARELREDPAIAKFIQQQQQDAKEAAAAEEGGKWLKTARSMTQAKKYDLARGYYQKIIDKYPGTKLAKTADEELKKLPQ